MPNRRDPGADSRSGSVQNERCGYTSVVMTVTGIDRRKRNDQSDGPDGQESNKRSGNISATPISPYSHRGRPDTGLAALGTIDIRRRFAPGTIPPSQTGRFFAAAASPWLRRTCRHYSVTAALDCECRCDLGTADRCNRSVRAGGDPAGTAGAARAARPVGREDPRAQSDRPCDRQGRDRSGKTCGRTGGRGARRSHRPAWCRSMDCEDIYLLACLGHADAWPAGDLALQEAARLAFGLKARAASRTTKEMAPLVINGGRRSIAARSLVILSSGERSGRRSRPAGKETSEKRKEWPLNLMVRGSIRALARRGSLSCFCTAMVRTATISSTSPAPGTADPAAGSIRLAARAGAMRAGSRRPTMVSTYHERSECRALDRRVSKRRPRCSSIFLMPSSNCLFAAVGPGAGRLQPGHDDGAACSVCGRATAPAAIVGYSGLLVTPPEREIEAVLRPGRRSNRDRRFCSCTATATI